MRTTRTLSNSLKKSVNKYVSLIIIHRTSQKTNGLQLFSGNILINTFFEELDDVRVCENLKQGHGFWADMSAMSAF